MADVVIAGNQVIVVDGTGTTAHLVLPDGDPAVVADRLRNPPGAPPEVPAPPPPEEPVPAASTEVAVASTVAPPPTAPFTVTVSYNQATKRMSCRFLASEPCTVWRSGNRPGTFQLAANDPSPRSFTVTPGALFEIRADRPDGLLVFSQTVPA